MNKKKIIRAWRDPKFRASLSEEERAALPEHPSGVIELADESLGMAYGASSNSSFTCDGVCIDLTLAPNCALPPTETTQCSAQVDCSSMGSCDTLCSTGNVFDCP
jgi:mersacidin/lichenicidin family type 2 lantibiotic